MHLLTSQAEAERLMFLAVNELKVVFLHMFIFKITRIKNAIVQH